MIKSVLIFYVVSTTCFDSDPEVYTVPLFESEVAKHVESQRSMYPSPECKTIVTEIKN